MPITRRIRTIVLLIVFIGLTLVVTGCEALRPKPIWTDEGWQAYKDDVSNTLWGLFWILVLGLVPSGLGLWFMRVRRRLKTGLTVNRVGSYSILVAISLLLALLVAIYFKIDRWWASPVTIVCFLLGCAGIVIYPKADD